MNAEHVNELNRSQEMMTGKTIELIGNISETTRSDMKSMLQKTEEFCDEITRQKQNMHISDNNTVYPNDLIDLDNEV